MREVSPVRAALGTLVAEGAFPAAEGAWPVMEGAWPVPEGAWSVPEGAWPDPEGAWLVLPGSAQVRAVWIRRRS